MKRRDFLLSSAGVVGLLPAVARGQVASPCPPPSMAAEGGTNASSACRPSGDAPSWFVEMPERAWATPVGNTVSSVFAENTGGSSVGVVNAYTGAAIDQDYGEMILPANGGHTDYAGNEVYRCVIRSETPSWFRVTEPSNPDSNDDGGSSMQYADGNPRSAHGWYKHIGGNGKVYLAGTTGVWQKGRQSTAVHMFDRASLGANPGTLSAAAAPWRYLGLGITDPNALNAMGSNVDWQGGPCAYDKVNRKIWSAPRYNVNSAPQPYFAINTITDTIERPVVPYPNGRISGAETAYWSVVAHDLGVWIVASTGLSQFSIMDVNNPQAGFQKKVTTTGAFTTDNRAGAVYYKDSSGARWILTWVQDAGLTVRKCSVPANPLTSTPADWVWSDYITAGVPPANNSRMVGVHSKFNIIDDMGDGRPALVCLTDSSGPVYVNKLPDGRL